MGNGIENLNKIAKEMEKANLLSSESIISAKDEEGNINFLGEPLKEFFDIYEKNENIKTVMWAHPQYIEEFSKRKISLPPVLDDMAQVIGPVAKLGSLKDTPGLLKIFKNAKAAFVKEGGAVLVGNSLKEVYTNLLILEKAAMVFIEGPKLSGAKAISHSQAKKLRKEYVESYSKKEEKKITSSTSDIQREEDELRKEIISVGKKLLSSKLVAGTFGNISGRLDENTMVITPSGLSYEDLKPGDLVKVDINTLEAIGENEPSTEKGMHARIYKEHNDALGILHTHPVYASVFAACGREVPIVNDDVRRIVKGPATVTNYKRSGSNALSKNVSNALLERKGCLLANHGMVTFGESLKEAYTVSEVIEKAAKDYLNKKKVIWRK